ncbi:MAG: hypothetical protein H0W88_10400 [Parachlamydiaceae bacterium]|nr:hypothetical protein [Parachlamydiaceae bacterium]
MITEISFASYVDLPQDIKFKMTGKANYDGRDWIIIERKLRFTWDERLRSLILALALTIRTYCMGLALPFIADFWEEAIIGEKKIIHYLDIFTLPKNSNIDQLFDVDGDENSANNHNNTLTLLTNKSSVQ